MTDIISGNACKTKAAGRKITATASSTKARKATSRGKLSTTTATPPIPDAKPQPSQDQDPLHSQDSPKPSCSTKAKGEEKATTENQQWQQGNKAKSRAKHNEEKKRAKRERKNHFEAKRASAREKAKAAADAAHAKAQAEANARRPRPPPSFFFPTFPIRGISAKRRYQLWAESCDTFFADTSASAAQFPLPIGLGGCERRKCIKGDKLGFCHHQLLELVAGSGGVSLTWLKRERLRWHPDKFPGREEVRERAQEMFQMLQRLIDGDSPRDWGIP